MGYVRILRPASRRYRLARLFPAEACQVPGLRESLQVRKVRLDRKSHYSPEKISKVYTFNGSPAFRMSPAQNRARILTIYVTILTWIAAFSAVPSNVVIVKQQNTNLSRLAKPVSTTPVRGLSCVAGNTATPAEPNIVFDVLRES